MLSRRWLVVLGISALGIAFGTLYVNAQGNDPATDVAALLKRIAALEERVRNLEAGAPRIVIGDNDPQEPEGNRPMVIRPGKLPEGWSQREFNGVPYYIVPLQNEKGATP